MEKIRCKCWLNIVVCLAAIHTVTSIVTYNPVNNLPPPGQSGYTGPVFHNPPPTTSNPFVQPVNKYPQFGPIHVPGVPQGVPPPLAPPLPSGTSSIGRLVQEAVGKVRTEDATMRDRLQGNIDRNPTDLQTIDPLLFSESPENATEFSVQCRTINWISRLLKRDNIGQSLSSVLSSPEAAQYSIRCPFVPPAQCERGTRYRTVDGSCNNLQHKLWGAAFTPFLRLLPAVYESDANRDDLPQSRGLSSGRLRSARDISTSFHEPPTGATDDSRFTVLLTVYGQFLAHDVTDRAPTKGYQQSVLKCCNQGIRTPSGICDNIPIPQGDEFRQFRGDCLEFARSLEVTDVNCQTGIREQLNQASSYIDGGSIYGATQSKLRSLRLFTGGLLMTSVPNQLPIFPPENAHAAARGFAFYAIGDNRVNEFIGLIGMETIWAREHNRIAKEMAMLNPQFSDETLFQETRRLIIALIQHITFNEYLPNVLGNELMQAYNLNFYTGYNPQVNAGLTNSFAATAMRFGHSMLPTTYSLRNRQVRRNGDDDILLEDSFFKPQQFLMNQDPFMRGMAEDPSKLCDRVFSTGVVNHLYETDVGTGSDLAAANIQRGRDHGLPKYVDFRSHFTMPTPQRFDTSLLGFSDHDPDTVKRLQQIYSDPREVELFPAAISETPIKDGAVGPLFGNILAQQFRRLKEGDRHWFETTEQPQAFTPDQLFQIKRVTLARIICNTFGFEMIQPHAFLVEHPVTNRRVPCGTLPSLNLAQGWTTTGK